MNRILPLLLVLILVGCGTAPRKSEVDNEASFVQVSTDSTYGYTKENPIVVGDGNFRNGARNERLYLETLVGPNGEQVSYKRLGSCCGFETPNGYLGKGLLDKYEVKYRGIESPIVLYFNFYDVSEKYIPVGFTAKK